RRSAARLSDGGRVAAATRGDRGRVRCRGSTQGLPVDLRLRRCRRTRRTSCRWRTNDEPGVDGAGLWNPVISVVEVANPFHHTYNDPLNKTDPLGLRPQECELSRDGTCPVVIDDVDPSRRGASVGYTIGSRARNDCYTAWHSAA